MRNLLGKSVILTILIVSMVIITTYSQSQNISFGIKLLLFVVAGALLVVIALMIGGIRVVKKIKPVDDVLLAGRANKTKNIEHGSGSNNGHV